MEHDLPPGFQRISGKRAPPDPEQRWHILLRCGFADMQHSYTRNQLVWIWGPEPSGGDIIAVKRAE